MKKLGLLIILILSILNADNDKMPKECKQKRYCSQMTSCEEAKYYLKLCGKYAKMDGNNDGVPCERQWCGSK
jgi:hypothetical protein